jgi:hypothetical protein
MQLITFSGPESGVGRVIDALRDHGYDARVDEDRSGFPEEPGVGWVEATGETIDAAVEIAARLGFALRLHGPAPEHAEGLPISPTAISFVESLSTADPERLEAALRALRGEDR